MKLLYPQAVAVSKTDIELQFVEQDTVDREVSWCLLRDAACGSFSVCSMRPAQDECVMEMRLYVPPKHRRLKEKLSAAAAEAGSDGEEGEEVEDERSTAEVRGRRVGADNTNCFGRL